MGRARRTWAAVAAGLGAVALIAALFLPWWSVARESDGDVQLDERQAPFRQSDRSAGDNFRLQTLVLGLVVSAAAVLQLAAFALAAVRVRGGPATQAAAWQTVAATAAAAAILYAVWAMPAEANEARGRSDLTFWGRECSNVIGVDICIVTRPLIGLWAAAGGTGLGLAALALIGLPTRAPGTRPRVGTERPAFPSAPSAPPASARPPASWPGAGPAVQRGVRVLKCPQCQTKMTFGHAGPMARDCPNCGRRVRA